MNERDESPEALAGIVRSLGIANARRHIFLCSDPAKPKCCDRERGIAAWDYLKSRLKDLGLSIDQLVPVSEDAAALDLMNYIPRAMSSDDLFDLIKQAY